MNYWDLSVCLGFLLLAFTAALGSYRKPRPGSAELARILGSLAACLALFLGMAFTLRPRADEKIERSVPHQDLAGEYASSTNCRSCHPGEHRSWHESYHRSMTMVAGSEGIKAPFDGRELKLGKTTYRIWQDGDEYWVRTPDPDLEFALLKQNEMTDSFADFYYPRQHPAPPMVDRRVVMTTGSHKMQMYWLPSRERDQELRLFPWVYFIPEKKWIPYEDSFIVDPRLGRPPALWTSNCIICHSVNGNPKFTFKQLQNGYELDTSVSELGIACEACHGPAAEHVKRHSNPITRYQDRLDDKPDPTIFNPARATQQQSAEACGQCHSTFEPVSMKDFLEHGNAFRPGAMRLDRTHRLIFQGSQTKETDTYHDNFWRDGSVRIGGREYLGMAISACFQEGSMTCLDCHSMHNNTGPSDQLIPQASSNISCLRCHEAIGDSLGEHTHHAETSEGSRCYNCHMPHTSFALMGAIRSHRIDSPSVANEVRSGRPNACNLCHLDRTLQWTSEQLASWYGHDPVALEKDQAEVAASVRWILGGDAVQRTIGAWHMGWQPAIDASGENWQLPLLNVIRTDDYSINRFVSQHAMKAHSLYRRLSGDTPYDFIDELDQCRQVQQEFLQRWLDSPALPDLPAAVLLQPDGSLDTEAIDRLIEGRDNRSIMVAE
jgi:protein-arginine kinase activator protein McsA